MLKRTPPNSPSSKAANSKNGSEPKIPLQKNEEKPENKNVTQRKRKRDDEELIRMENLMQSMQKMVSDLVVQQTQQNLKIDSLKTAIDDIKIQNIEIQRSVEFMSQKYDEAVQKIEELKEDTSKNKNYIRVLETKIDSMERSPRASSVELKNIPKEKVENKESLTVAVQKISQIINQPVQKSEIKEIFRTKSKAESEGLVIVEFTSSSIKESFLRSVKKFNRENNQDRLSTSHLQAQGMKKQIYISESLTAKTKRLFYLGREFIKTNDYEHCWTANGRVYIRKKEGCPSQLITSEEDFSRLKQVK